MNEEQQPISRYILKAHHPELVTADDDGWRFDTGANYEGCSRDNPTACDPQQFKTEADAFYYAQIHQEIPLRVTSETQAWDLVERSRAGMPGSVGLGVVGGIGILILLGWLFSRSGAVKDE